MVSIACACCCTLLMGQLSVGRSSNLQVVRELGQILAAVVRDEHEVLQPHAAEAAAVRSRLDREHVAGDEPVARSRGARSTITGSPGTIWPEPSSCPIAVCGPCETIAHSSVQSCSPATL